MEIKTTKKMGKCEESVVYVGVQAKMSQLHENLNKDNYEMIAKYILTPHSTIVDTNEDFNNIFEEIKYDIGYEKLVFFEVNKWFLDFKSKFQNMYNESYICVPIGELCNRVERWGYSREGINANTTKLEMKKIIELQSQAHAYIITKLPVEVDFEVVILNVLQSG